MSVITVNGIVSNEELGIISPHEHVLIDITNQFVPFDALTDRLRSMEKVHMGNLDILSRNPYAVKDNLILDETEVAIEELTRFKKAGGKTIVDVTLPGIGRDVLFLQDVSNLLGINVITGTGFYTGDTHPDWVKEAEVGELAEHMLIELTKGIAGTDIRAGIIGEIGTSREITDSERRVLLASAIAQKETGVAVEIHTYPWSDAAYEAARMMVDEGVDPGKIAILHRDVAFDLTGIHKLLDLGVILEFDNFGKQYYVDERNRGFAGGIFEMDYNRVRLMKQLCEEGYTRQLIMATDICLKQNLHKYGGYGYDHVLRNIVPMMRSEKMEQEHIDTILKENPVVFLSIER